MKGIRWIKKVICDLRVQRDQEEAGSSWKITSPQSRVHTEFSEGHTGVFLQTIQQPEEHVICPSDTNTVQRGLTLTQTISVLRAEQLGGKKGGVCSEGVSYLDPMYHLQQCSLVLVVHKEGGRGRCREIFFFHHSVSFRPHGRRHSWPRSWIHLFDTKEKDVITLNF